VVPALEYPGSPELSSRMSDRILAIPLRTRPKKETYLLSYAWMPNRYIHRNACNYFFSPCFMVTDRRCRERTLLTRSRLSIALSVKGLSQFGAKNTRLAFARYEMSTLRASKMSGMSRGFIFDLSVLSM